MEGEKVDADPEEIASDNKDSDYLNNDYNPDLGRILEEQITTSRTIRGGKSPQRNQKHQ